MSISVYKVQTVLNSYLKQLKVDESSREKDGKKLPKDVVSISGEAKKKSKANRMGVDAVRSLHQMTLKPFVENDEKAEDI